MDSFLYRHDYEFFKNRFIDACIYITRRCSVKRKCSVDISRSSGLTYRLLALDQSHDDTRAFVRFQDFSNSNENGGNLWSSLQEMIADRIMRMKKEAR